MKNLALSLLIFLFGTSSIPAQLVRKDTLVKNQVYEAMYSYKYGQPRYVKYKLYHGGGECSRSKEHFHFRVDSLHEVNGLRDVNVGSKDYAGSGYDEGHMANAEDFASDCKKEELTFRFYNCIPQTPKLNRGIWKSNESLVRKWSQTDSVMVICGGIITPKSKTVTQISTLTIPDKCYKVVISLTNHKLLEAVIYDNNDDPKEYSVKLLNIESQTHFFFGKLVGFSIVE